MNTQSLLNKMATITYDDDVKKYRIVIDKSDEKDVKTLDCTTDNIELIGIILNIAKITNFECSRFIRSKILSAQKKQNDIKNETSSSCTIS